MLSRVVIFCAVLMILVIGAISYSNFLRYKKIEQNTKDVRSLVAIGSDIFEAKRKLEKAGFTISYGPDFPTASETYYLMIIDYGLHPSGWDKFRELINKPGHLKLSGIVEADENGDICKVE